MIIYVGGIIQMMYSRNLIGRVSDAMGGIVVTVQNMTSFLQQFISVTECSVGSYLAIDNTLVVIVSVSSVRPTVLQVTLRSYKVIQTVFTMSHWHVELYVRLRV